MIKMLNVKRYGLSMRYFNYNKYKNTLSNLLKLRKGILLLTNPSSLQNNLFAIIHIKVLYKKKRFQHFRNTTVKTVRLIMEIRVLLE